MTRCTVTQEVFLYGILRVMQNFIHQPYACIPSSFSARPHPELTVSKPAPKALFTSVLGYIVVLFLDKLEDMCGELIQRKGMELKLKVGQNPML